MSSAIIRNGHWRRRDELAGLTDSMRAALKLAAERPLYCLDGQFRHDIGEPGIAPSTVTALEIRGLMRRRFSPDSLRPHYLNTPAGQRLVGILRQRADVRARLIADKPARALSEGTRS